MFIRLSSGESSRTQTIVFVVDKSENRVEWAASGGFSADNRSTGVDSTRKDSSSPKKPRASAPIIVFGVLPGMEVRVKFMYPKLKFVSDRTFRESLKLASNKIHSIHLDEVRYFISKTEIPPNQQQSL
jgi:hypothetical protein